MILLLFLKCISDLVENNSKLKLKAQIELSGTQASSATDVLVFAS